MWVKKSEVEFLEDERRRRVRQRRIALALWVFFTVFPPLVAPRYGIHPSSGHYFWQMPNHKAIAISMFGLFATALLSGIGVYMFYWRPRRTGGLPKVLVCPKCE